MAGECLRRGYKGTSIPAVGVVSSVLKQRHMRTPTLAYFLPQTTYIPSQLISCQLDQTAILCATHPQNSDVSRE